jgi:hypothetical protein
MTLQSQARDIRGGDRIRIRQGKRLIPDLVGRTGTIVEVFRVPRDSCLVRIGDDMDRLCEWFFIAMSWQPAAYKEVFQWQTKYDHNRYLMAFICHGRGVGAVSAPT